MSNSDHRFLIVSLGSIGRRHLRNLRTLYPTSTIAVLRLQGREQQDVEGCNHQFSTMEQVRAFAPQAAFIAAPASRHVDIAMHLIAMSVPVFIEKPFSHNLDGLRSLITAASMAGVPVMIGYNLRFKSSLIEARRRLVAGEIGEVLFVRSEVGQYLPQWRPDADYRHSVSAQAALGGGALLELSHEIDYLYWLFGLPSSVSCRGGRFAGLDIDVEDMVELCFEYEHAPRLVSVHLDFIQRVVSRSCKFVGSEGNMVWDGIADTITVNTVANGAHLVRMDPMDSNAVYVDELVHFLDCIAKGTAPAIDPIQAYEVMAVIEAARLSMKNHSVERPVPYAIN